MIRDFVEGIMNGLKRAVLFVVDVLLFIPRLIVGGIVGFLVKEVKAAAIEEDEVEEEPDEDDEEPDEDDDEDDEEEEEESDEDDDDTDKVSRILKKSLNPSDQEIPIAVALSTAAAAAAAAPEEPDTPKEAEEDEKDDSEEESSSSEKKKTTPAKKTKASSKPEKVEGEVIEVFGKSDSKAAQYETAFMNFFNNASAKYAKDQWVDGAIELQKFARSFLDALSIKEGITPLKGKDVTADKRYKDLLDKLDSKIKFTEDEKKKLEICLGCQGRTSESAVRPQMEVAFKLINTYQAHYYEAWVQMQKATA